MLKTVMFTAMAFVLVGMPHGAPVSVTVRAVLSRSGELFRESYCRHGVIGNNVAGPDPISARLVRPPAEVIE
jgi:hypothetical protein